MKLSKHRKQYLSHKIEIILTFAAFPCQAHFHREVFEDIQRDFTNNEEVFRRVVFTCSASILVKYRIQAPISKIINKGEVRETGKYSKKATGFMVGR